MNDEISLLSVATLMLRGRRLILGLALAGAVIGMALALLRPRVFTASAMFIPEESEQGSSNLARAASQFGITVPSAGSRWGPPVYIELLRSHALLGPLALDTLPVAEEAGRRIAVVDLLGVSAPTIPRETDLAVRALESRISISEEKSLGGVRLSVSTRWPSVSLAIAERLVRGVGKFNVERRKSQAAAERQFVDGLASEAERDLRTAEFALQSFLQRNREIGGSPQLAFERERLQREVGLRQQLYTSLLQSREEARIREIRDTPVITVLEEPRLPVVAEPRNTIRKTLIGVIGGTLVGILISFLGHGLAGARTSPNKLEREFFELLMAVRPRFRKRARIEKKQHASWAHAEDQT